MSVSQRITHQIFRQHEANWPRKPMDWYAKFATPYKSEDKVILFEVDLMTPGLKLMQIRDDKDRFKLLWKMPFHTSSRKYPNRQTAIDWATRYAREHHWKLVPYAILSFVGSW